MVDPEALRQLDLVGIDCGQPGVFLDERHFYSVGLSPIGSGRVDFRIKAFDTFRRRWRRRPATLTVDND